METKIVRTLVAVLVTLTLLAGTFAGGILVGWSLPGRQAAVNPPPVQVQQPGVQDPSALPPIPQPTQVSGGDLDLLMSPFWETWDLVHDQYVDQPIDDTALMRGAIQGMLSALGDPHTSYMDPAEYETQLTSLGGEYEGIGAWVDLTGEYLSIISPMPGSPAEAAGLKPGDMVIAVDGVDMTSTDGEIVLDHILGPAGTPVTLTIQRSVEAEPFDVTIVRARITVPSVAGEMLDGGIAYVQLFEFGENSGSELHAKIAELMANQPTAMILDLRYNGGGYITTAVEVISEFIEGGAVIFYEQYGDGSLLPYRSSPNGLATQIPLVVLVNEGSASASEIAAGAIQDLERGRLVGAVTYGKGSVQNWVALQDDQGAVRVTVARWLTPNQRQINQVGLQPDVLVEITDEDIQLQRDSQLEKAIELLTTAP